MATKTEAGAETPVTMADIAATLFQSPTGGDDQKSGDATETEDLEDDTETDEIGEVDDEEAEAEDAEAESGDLEDDESEDDDIEEDDDEIEYLDIQDTDLITVMVDGEEQEVSIGDLKRAHSGEGAIEKRLQEATETRKAAHAEQVQALEKLAADERLLTEALDGLDDNLFKAVIPPPNEQLRRTNPDQFLRHQDAYNADQARIAEAKKAIENKRAELEKARAERLNEFAQKAAPIIAQEIPELANPKTAEATYNKLAETAMSYGYTQEEIGAALDPRMFMLVRDAMKYRDIMARTKETNVTDISEQREKKVRRLRSGNTSAKTRVKQADQKRKAAVARAKKTGKVDDVAATLLIR